MGHPYWPVIDELLLHEDIHPVRWLDATSPKPAARGRPPKNPVALAPGFSEKPHSHLNGVIHENPGALTSGFRENPGALTQKPRGSGLDDFTVLHFTGVAESREGLTPTCAQIEEKGSEARQWRPTDEQCERYGKLFNGWGVKDDAIILAPTERAVTDKNLTTVASGRFSAIPHEIISQAINETLAYCEGLPRKTGLNGGSSFANYFAKTKSAAHLRLVKLLAATQADVQVAAEVAAIKVAKERTIADQGIEAHRGAIAQGTAARQKALDGKAANGSGRVPPPSTASETVEALSMRGIRKGVCDFIERLLPMSPKLADPIVWGISVADAVDDADDEMLRDAAEHIVETCEFRPSIAGMKRGIGARRSAMRRFKQAEETLNVIRAEWEAFKRRDAPNET